MRAVATPMECRLDAELRRLLETIRSLTNKDGCVYLAGGAVRDLLRRRAPADLDVLVDGDAWRAARSTANAFGGHAFALDAERAQMRVVLEGGPVREIDFAPIKGDLESDLRARDFSVNALAVPIELDGSLGAVIDVCGGRADLGAKRLRMVSEANLRDDPLRLLRAVRLAVELEFEIEDATAAAVRRNALLIRETAAERQSDELARILATPRAAPGVRLLDSLGLLEQLLPELMAARGVAQPVVHYWDVFDHSIETLAALDALLAEAEPATPEERQLRSVFREALAGYPLDRYVEEKTGGRSRRVLLKLAGLLHDVAKPETKTIEASGRVRFFGHPEIGARKAEQICRRLRFGNREAKFIAQLVEEHLRPTQLSQNGVPSRRALYRFFRDLGEAAPACLILALADGVAAAGPCLEPERWRDMVADIADILEAGGRQEAAAPAARLVTGDDLMASLGIEPGPLVGRLLTAVEEAIGAGEIASREEGIAYAKRLLPEWRQDEKGGGRA